MSRVRRRTLLGGAIGLTAAALGCTPAPVAAPVTGVAPSSAQEGSSGSGSIGGPFPPGFVWGAGTSAYQVEGAAALDGRGPSVWDTFAHQGRAGGDNGDVATDQYHRYQGDVDLMVALGLRSYRFSISWSRVQPEGAGAVNQRGLDYYRRLVDALTSAGIQPMATLWHWDTPQQLQDLGGWENREVAQRFADYADLIIATFGADIPTYLTMNEPKTVVQAGYSTGTHAPGIADPVAATRALHHLLLGHGLAVQAFRARGPRSRIGIALGLAEMQPADSTDRAAQLVRQSDVRENTLYLEPVLNARYPDQYLSDAVDIRTLDSMNRTDDLRTIGTPIDVLGVNYYGSATVGGRARHPLAEPAHWLEIDPDSLYRMLVRLHRDYRAPLLTVTENGRPDPPTTNPSPVLADTDRMTYLRSYLVQAQRAVAAGVRMLGWHVWSLLDNFEWADGYRQRWGIVHVDFATLARAPKSSASWYAGVIRANSI